MVILIENSGNIDVHPKKPFPGCDPDFRVRKNSIFFSGLVRAIIMERREPKNADKIKGYFKDKYPELSAFYDTKNLWIRPSNRSLSETEKRHFCPVQPRLVTKWIRDFQTPRYHPDSTDEEYFQITLL